MKKVISLLIVVLFLLAPTISYGEGATPSGKPKGFGISVSPSNVRLEGPPGLSKTFSVKVINNGAKPMMFQTEINDFKNEVDESGRLKRVFLPAGTTPFSCSKWILIQDRDFIVEPDSYRDVPITISSPVEEEGSKSAVIFFRGTAVDSAAAGDDAESRTASIQISPRLGVLVFYDVVGTVERTGELLDFSFDYDLEEASAKLQYLFKNTGNADILLTGNFYLLDENKALAARGQLGAVRTFPGDEGTSETLWKGVIPPGKYQLVLTLELGPNAQEVIVKEYSVAVED